VDVVHGRLEKGAERTLRPTLLKGNAKFQIEPQRCTVDLRRSIVCDPPRARGPKLHAIVVVRFRKRRVCRYPLSQAASIPAAWLRFHAHREVAPPNCDRSVARARVAGMDVADSVRCREQ